MGEDFNTDSMLDIFLYESEQLLETLQNVVVAVCIPSKDLRVL